MATKRKLTRRELDIIKLENESYDQLKTRMTVQIFLDDWLKIDRIIQNPKGPTKSEFVRTLIHNALATMEIPKYKVS